MPQEVGAPARGLDQDHFPVRPGELDNQPRDSWPAADVEQRAPGRRDDCQQHQGLQHQVSEPGGRVAVRGERTDSLPPIQLGEIRLDGAGEPLRQGQPERPGGIPDGSLEVARRRHR